MVRVKVASGMGRACRCGAWLLTLEEAGGNAESQRAAKSVEPWTTTGGSSAGQEPSSNTDGGKDDVVAGGMSGDISRSEA